LIPFHVGGKNVPNGSVILCADYNQLKEKADKILLNEKIAQSLKRYEMPF
jgi:hypothetical protein